MQLNILKVKSRQFYLIVLCFSWDIVRQDRCKLVSRPVYVCRPYRNVYQQNKLAQYDWRNLGRPSNCNASQLPPFLVDERPHAKSSLERRSRLFRGYFHPSIPSIIPPVSYLPPCPFSLCFRSTKSGLKAN